MTDPAQLPYRPCVGVMLVNRDGLVFVGQRIDNKEGDAWQMPQGGVDSGEDIEQAALRELEEETGITPDRVQIQTRSGREHFYDLPEQMIGRIWNGKYRGQRQTWFLARFLGQDSDINIATDHPEFDAWQWVPADSLVNLIVPFKKQLYRDVVAEFQDLI
ncbi:MAG TPA: RNA pyrophosphohydrolase [Sphingobium sp.]|nr:RNA pyrophosphohydrolase [Sphingobium sp.]